MQTSKPNVAGGDTLFSTPPVLNTSQAQRGRVIRVLEVGLTQGAHPRHALARAAWASRTTIAEMIKEGLVREATDGSLSLPPRPLPRTPADRDERLRRNHAEAVLRDRRRMGLISSDAELERQLRARTGS